MRLLSKVMVGVAVTVVLTLGVLALTARSAAQLEVSLDGDPIILKGGSLTVHCPLDEQCLAFNATTKKYEHKTQSKKITKIVVKDESGNVLFSATGASFPNGKPSIEVTYK